MKLKDYFLNELENSNDYFNQDGTQEDGTGFCDVVEQDHRLQLRDFAVSTQFKIVQQQIKERGKVKGSTCC